MKSGHNFITGTHFITSYTNIWPSITHSHRLESKTEKYAYILIFTTRNIKRRSHRFWSESENVERLLIIHFLEKNGFICWFSGKQIFPLIATSEINHFSPKRAKIIFSLIWMTGTLNIRIHVKIDNISL